MSAALIVPIVGGIAMLVGVLLSVWVDRQDLLLQQHESTARPVLIRYLSAATFDLHKRPHWISLTGSCIFGPCIVVTSYWQSLLAEENAASLDDNNNNNDDGLPLRLALFGILTGSFAVALAASPMGTCTGTVFHMIFAGGFVAMGIQYNVNALALARALSNDPTKGVVVTIRLVFTIVGGVGCAIMIFFTGAGAWATDAIQAHEKAVLVEMAAKAGNTDVVVDSEEEGGLVAGKNAINGSIPEPDKPPVITDGDDDDDNNNSNNENNSHSDKIMKPRQILQCRLWEVILAIGQILVGISEGIILLTAVVDVNDERIGGGSNNDNHTWIVATGSFGASCLVLVLAVVLNERFYVLCQKAKTEVSNER